MFEGFTIPFILFAVTSVLAAMASAVAKKKQAEAKARAQNMEKINRASDQQSEKPQEKPYNPYATKTKQDVSKRQAAKPTIDTKSYDDEAGHATGEAESVEPIVGSLGEVKTEGCFEHSAFRFISKETENEDEFDYDYDKIAAAIVFGSVLSEPAGFKENKL